MIGPRAARAWPASSAGHMRGQGPRACAGRARAQRGPVTVFKPKTSVASFQLVSYNYLVYTSLHFKNSLKSIVLIHLLNVVVLRWPRPQR